MSLISLKEISKLYGFGDATTVALEDVSLDVLKGEFVAIMGPSGSGKSTLMNMIGLLDRPTHGTYKLDERYVERLRSNTRAKVRRDKIGFVFQSSSLLNDLTALENVALPLAYKGVRLGKRIKMAHEMLERVGLSNRAYYLPRQLSGGQMQRVAIARALINNPDIVIADEPTGNLDSASSRLVMELLREVHRMGNTILMVTHNPELTRYANRVLFMYDGNIARDEKTKLGEIAEGAIESVAFVPQSDEDADLEAVSVMVEGIPKAGDDIPYRKVRLVKKKTKAKPIKKRKKSKKK
jgi:putative ABC transport system ATP-binding protein